MRVTRVRASRGERNYLTALIRGKGREKKRKIAIPRMPRDPLDDNDWRLHNDHFCATMDECVHRRLFVARSAAIRASYGAKTVLTRQRLFIERVAVNGLV